MCGLAQSATACQSATPPRARHPTPPRRAPDTRAARSHRPTSVAPSDPVPAQTVLLRRPFRAAVLRQSQAAGVDQHLPRPAPDHAGQHRHRDIVDRVGKDLRLEQITEHVDASTNFGDAVERRAVQRGRRTTHRDDRRRNPAVAQPLGRAHHAPIVPPPRCGPCPRRCARRSCARHASSTPARFTPSRSAIASSASSSGATPPRDSPVSISINARGGFGWPAIAPAASRSSVNTMTSAPASFSLATWSSFCGTIPTA